MLADLPQDLVRTCGPTIVMLTISLEASHAAMHLDHQQPPAVLQNYEAHLLLAENSASSSRLDTMMCRLAPMPMAHR